MARFTWLQKIKKSLPGLPGLNQHKCISYCHFITASSAPQSTSLSPSSYQGFDVSRISAIHRKWADLRPISRFVSCWATPSIDIVFMAFSQFQHGTCKLCLCCLQHLAGPTEGLCLVHGCEKFILLCLIMYMERPRTKKLFTKALSAIAFCPILFCDFTQDQQWPLLCILPAEQKRSLKRAYTYKGWQRETELKGQEVGVQAAPEIWPCLGVFLNKSQCGRKLKWKSN